MELKVYVDGIVKIISGVDEDSTCQDVVFALAHATGKTGRFVLIEKWRNNSRLLGPQESPLKLLNKLGEYSGEVQFILQKSDKSNENIQASQISNEIAEKKMKENQKFQENTRENVSVGIIKGVPQKNQILGDKNFISLNGEPSTANNNTNTESDVRIAEVNSKIAKIKPPPYVPPPKVKFSEKNNLNPDELLVKDLVQLLKLQREKIVNQQNDLAKFDAEISYLERKSREQLQLEKHHLDLITKDILQQDLILKQGNEQLNILKHIEDEKESAYLQESNMKAEMGYLKSKLNVLETEILQCKNKLKKIANEIQLEQKHYSKQYIDNGVLELKILSEIEKLKTDIDMAQLSSDSITKSTEALKNEVMAIDSSIIEKKKQLEKLIHEMKQVNLESLSSPEGEYCSTLENTVGTVKRKIIGSPRQLENAVATSKNPHGVWV